MIAFASKFGDGSRVVSIIDDDQSVREAIEGLMRWLGFGVAAYSSAVEFLGSANGLSSACIIADVQMPSMTGIELHTRLKALGHAIPTILITAYSDPAVKERALADGVLCYLCKPLDQDALIGCVNSALQPRGM